MSRPLSDYGPLRVSSHACKLARRRRAMPSTVASCRPSMDAERVRSRRRDRAFDAWRKILRGAVGQSVAQLSSARLQARCCARSCGRGREKPAGALEIGADTSREIAV